MLLALLTADALVPAFAGQRRPPLVQLPQATGPTTTLLTTPAPWNPMVRFFPAKMGLQCDGAYPTPANPTRVHTMHIQQDTLEACAEVCICDDNCGGFNFFQDVKLSSPGASIGECRIMTTCNPVTSNRPNDKAFVAMPGARDPVVPNLMTCVLKYAAQVVDFRGTSYKRFGGGGMKPLTCMMSTPLVSFMYAAGTTEEENRANCANRCNQDHPCRMFWFEQLQSSGGTPGTWRCRTFDSLCDDPDYTYVSTPEHQQEIWVQVRPPTTTVSTTTTFTISSTESTTTTKTTTTTMTSSATSTTTLTSTGTSTASTTTSTDTETTTTGTRTSTTTVSTTTSATTTATFTTTTTATTSTTTSTATTSSTATMTITTSKTTTTSTATESTTTNTATSSTTSTATSTQSTTTTVTSTRTATTLTMSSTTSTQSTATSTETTTTVRDFAVVSSVQLKAEARQDEDDLAQRLVANNGTIVSMRTSVAKIVARMVDMAEIQSGNAVSLDVPDSGISLKVPAAVLQAAGGNVVMSVSAFDQGASGSFEAAETGAAMAGPPVSIRLRSASTLQDVDFKDNLPAEIVIEMLGSAPADGSCAFWDEAATRWSGRGLTRVVGANGTLACATTHLTIFAVFIGEFERIVVCSNAHAFSGEGMRAIFQGDWWYRAPACILWVIFASQLVLLGWASVNDLRTYHKRVWRDADLLTTNEAFDGRDEGCKAWIMESVTRYLPGDDGAQKGDESTRPRKGCGGRIRALADSVRVTMTADCAHYQVARAERIAATDLRDFILGAPKTPGDEGTAAKPPVLCSECQTPYGEGERFCPSCGNRREAPASNNALEDSWKALRAEMDKKAHSLAETMRSKVPAAVERLATSGFCVRVWSMFWALHPWVQLRQFSIYIGAFVRALLLTAKLLGALMMCALFFDATGSALQLGSSAECQNQGFWSHFLRNVVVGLLSTIFSLFPLLVIGNMSSRRFIYQEAWDKATKRRYVRCWRTQDTLLALVAIAYCGLCIVYCMAFLANIDPSAEAEWLTSAVVVLIREFFLTPLSLAAVYAAVATCVSRARPELNEIVHHKVEDFVGITANIEDDVTELGERPGTETPTPDESDSWAERVCSGSGNCSSGHEVCSFRHGLSGALEALNEDSIPPQPLDDLEVEAVSKNDGLETPMSEAGATALPNMPDDDEATVEGVDTPTTLRRRSLTLLT